MIAATLLKMAKNNCSADGCCRFFLTVLSVMLATSATEAKLLEPLLKNELRDCREIIFCTRDRYNDNHWYANIGYFSDDSNHKAYTGHGKADNSVLYRYDLRSKERSVIMDARGGSIRDPHVNYDGSTILFSYRPAGSDHYNLYTINPDGSDLTQITSGPWDDYEGIFLPDGDLLFISTRCRRYVGCYYTQVGTMFRCRPDGSGIRSVSGNIEHDNTPAVMPDGRILYTRWEYIDRSQVEYHHLWVMNPDGTGVNVYYGNMHSWIVMIDARPIPGTQEVIACFSPGHGRNEHAGHPTIVSQQQGPDEKSAAVQLYKTADFRDPEPLGRDVFMFARGKEIVLLNRAGELESVYKHPDVNVHEPRLLTARSREPLIADRTDSRRSDGEFLLIDVYRGRNMEGIKRGEIKKLLILEALPKPINFSGGMDITTWSGSFNLERWLGTVPVEADGSAFFTVPANRPVFFVALDKNDMSVKRMHSFADLMPGEQTTCIGCHEARTTSPHFPQLNTVPLAAQRNPSKIKGFDGIPDVLDFNRDIQPILTRNCCGCHSAEKRSGSVDLSHRKSNKWSPAYLTLLANRQVIDGANGLGNRPPRSVGSSASPLLGKLSGKHHNVRATKKELLTVRLWIETAAPYCGSYAGVRNSEDQHYYNRVLGPITGAAGHVIKKRCASCHKNEPDRNTMRIPFDSALRRNVESKKLNRNTGKYERLVFENDPIRLFFWPLMVNFDNPELSTILRAPLAAEAGGLECCGVAVFKSRQDPDYQKILQRIVEAGRVLDEKPIWGKEGWEPNHQYIREMKRYGILPDGFDINKNPFDPFAVDQAYWRSFWSGRAQ
jgi:hypothetical protein